MDPIVEKGRRAISLRLSVAQRALKYIGETRISDEKRLLQYNVMAVSHWKYKSTVAYKHGW